MRTKDVRRFRLDFKQTSLWIYKLPGGRGRPWIYGQLASGRWWNSRADSGLFAPSEGCLEEKLEASHTRPHSMAACSEKWQRLNILVKNDR